MQIIQSENSRAMLRAAIFIFIASLGLGLLGYMGHNDATTVVGISFCILTIICIYAILNKKILLAKCLWAFCTPVIIFVMPIFFSLSQPLAVIGYGQLHIAGILFTAYTLQAKKEKPILWASLVLFTLSFIFYDRIIIDKNLLGTPYASFYYDNYGYLKFVQLIHLASIVYFIQMIQSNKVLIEEKMSSYIKKMGDFTSNLISASKNKLIHSGDLLKALEEILVTTSNVQDVSRMSIWEFDESRKVIKLVVGYDAVKNTFFYNDEINYGDCPVYHKHLLEEKIIAANDAQNDPRTSEFNKTYLKPLGIQSMLDAPFFVDQKFKGILCSEEYRSKREWDEMDQLFSVSVSKLISIAYYCTHRKVQYEELVKTSRDLRGKNEVMEILNTKMVEINGGLSEHINWKEEELRELKSYINEVSFKNSHHVRAPLSRILGLLNLYQLDPEETNKRMYVEHMINSAKELDDMIREMSRVLSKGQ